ncbi:hypothetical protein BDF20DRAFT_917297 [Mycotypha africana]|uniref:uncharacterized protein n=1 Tax=Mycotypha africana TaxID=64632 RepID=UPI002300EA93|nr:uncharacterized protein BDF20DRAFT_917297 [Mycotypha africana]KAI8967687.1 hypothetical protein BDF20DRAFT_917297 [Mycotypha africana]
MRNPLDIRKEHKTIKLAKKLQDEANKEWESELKRRREQELNDEAIAKELQAQLEEESRTTASPSSTATLNMPPGMAQNSSPPPLPAKPTAYNSASSNDSSILPLYSLSDSPKPNIYPRLPSRTSDNMASENPPSTYKPGLQFTISSPAPQPSTVFNTPTPPLPVRKAHDDFSAICKETAQSSPHQSIRPGMNQSVIGYQDKSIKPSSAFNDLPIKSQSSNSTILRMEMPTPTVTPNNNYDSSASFYVSPTNNAFNPGVTSAYSFSNGNSFPVLQNNGTMCSPVPFTSRQSDPIVLPFDEQAATNIHSQLSNSVTAQNNQCAQYTNDKSYPTHNTESIPYIQQPLQQHDIVYPSFQPLMHNNVSSTDNGQNSHAYHQPSSTHPQQYSNVSSVNHELQQQPNAQSSLTQSRNNMSLYSDNSQASTYKQSVPLAAVASNQNIPSNVHYKNDSNTLNLQPSIPVISTIEKHNEYTPIYKKHTEKPLFSSSTISLKPDEGSVHSDTEDDIEYDQNADVMVNEFKHRKVIAQPSIDKKSVKNRPPTPIESATIETNVENFSDDDTRADDTTSEVDYSDMIYKKGSEKSLRQRDEKDGWKMIKKAEQVTDESQLQPQQQSRQQQGEEEDSAEDSEDEEWQDDAIDPFADNVDTDLMTGSTTANKPTMTVKEKRRESNLVTTLSPTLEIIDPTMPKNDENSQRVSALLADSQKKKKKEGVKSIQIESSQTYMDGPRQYAEKESKDIEDVPFVRSTMTPLQASNSYSGSIHSITFSTPIAATMTSAPSIAVERPEYAYRGYSLPATASMQTATATTPYEQWHFPNDKAAPFSNTNTSSADPTLRMYSEHQLKVNAPIHAPTTVVETEHQFRSGVVPATDFGYLKEGEKRNKSLPTLPNATASEDRHITVASINPGQRVWIRIQPTDTGKALAERIQVVASYRTRRVTKIISKNGRDIPLNNKPLFDDWNELLNFTDGETWKVEWVPIENPYVDIITEGKEFMKQLKATLRSGTSSSDS